MGAINPHFTRGHSQGPDLPPSPWADSTPPPHLGPGGWPAQPTISLPSPWKTPGQVVSAPATSQGRRWPHHFRWPGKQLLLFQAAPAVTGQETQKCQKKVAHQKRTVSTLIIKLSLELQPMKGGQSLDMKFKKGNCLLK